MLGTSHDAPNQDVRREAKARHSGARGELLREWIQGPVPGQVNHHPDPDCERHDAHEREWETHASKSYQARKGAPEAVHDPPYNQPALKLMIIGCGRVGSQIAANMDRAGHEVVIVDRDPNAFSRASTRGVLTRDFKGDQVVGSDAPHARLAESVSWVDPVERTLRRAGIERADGFVAVTEGDNRNIMASQIAKHVYKVPHVVARIYDPERAEAYEKLGLHTICPTIEGARHIEKVLMERETG